MAWYCTGIDWAQKRDSTVAAVARCETTPLQLVAVYRTQRRPWPIMTAQVGSLLDAFPGPAAHDATGAGNAMGAFPALAPHDQLQGVTLVGRGRTDLFRNDIGAIERHEIVCPRIDVFYTEHLYCGEDDLFGNGHPPETVVALALAYHAFKRPAAHRRDAGTSAGGRDTMTPAKRPSTRARQTPIQSLDDLQPDPLNANRGTDRGREALRRSLHTYGAGRSIVIDKRGRILGGHKTVEQAKHLGPDFAGAVPITVVPTTGQELVVVQRVDLDARTDPRAQELALADNRVAELDLDWDPAVLRQLEQAGVALEAFWTPEEFARLLAPEGPEAQPDENTVLAPPTTTTIRRGDVFQLGRHRLACGDATSATDVARLLAGAVAGAGRPSLPWRARNRGVHLDNRSHHGAWGPRHRGDTTRDTGQPPSCPTSRCDVVLYQPCHVALATHRGLTSLPLHASVYAGDEAATSPSARKACISRQVEGIGSDIAARTDCAYEAIPPTRHHRLGR